MTDEQSRTRRSVLGTIAVLFGTVLGVSVGAASRRTDEPNTSPKRRAARKRGLKTERITRPRTGIYDGTIDRIVDGEHVVILVESGGETVGQEVVDRDVVPGGEEGDSVTVWLFRGWVLSVRVD